MTEPVTPLAVLLKTQTEVDIALGIHNIATCLSFLHKDANISHNNIRLTSIFVNQKDNLWRLGGLNFACKHQDVNAKLVNDLIKSAGSDAPASPEDIDGTFSSNLIHARDSWMMGHLISRLLGSFSGKADGQLVKFKQAITKFYCSSDPRKRPVIESLLVSPYFKTLPQQALIESVEFLQSITVKSEEERKDFFRKASNDLFHVPSEMFQKYLMRLIFSDIVFSDENAREYLLPRLLSVKTKRESRGFYKSESYFNIMGPQLQELYKRRAKHTRLVLLRLTRWYVPYLPSHFVCDCILSEVLLGLKDNDDAIVMATFNALAVLTSFVGSATVVGGDRTSNFYDAFPRGREAIVDVEVPSTPGITSDSFVKALDGKVANESDLDSGQEYPKVHVTSNDRLQAEKEMRMREFKKRREAQNKKKKQSVPPKENQKLLDMAQIISEEVISMTLETGREPYSEQPMTQLVHEQEGFSMEYKDTMASGAEGAWDNEDLEGAVLSEDTHLDMESQKVTEIETNIDLVLLEQEIDQFKMKEEEIEQLKLRELAEQSVEDHEQSFKNLVLELQDDGEIQVELKQEVYENKDYSSQASEEKYYHSDSDRKPEETPSISLLDIAQGKAIPEEDDVTITSPTRAKHMSDGFSNWENGGWSEFENSDGNARDEDERTGRIEEEVVRGPTLGEVASSTVSDFINLHEIQARAVEPEEDFFADMKPTYQAPKLL